MTPQPTIDDYRISKQEEAEALSFIKRVLVPDVVEYFEASKTSYGRPKDDVVNPQEIAKNLRKVAHFHAGQKGNPSDESDRIEYEGYDETENFWPPTPFKFIIVKDHLGNRGWICLEAGYIDPLKRGQSTVTMVKRTKYYPSLRIDRIVEGKNHRRQEVSIPLLSKREKDEAFHKLKLIILPKAVNTTNNYLIGQKGKDTPQVSVREALQYLKKMSDNGNRVVYKAEIPGKAAIILFTEKKNTPFVLNKFGQSMVYIGFNLPGGNFPHEFLMQNQNPSLEESDDHLPFSQRRQDKPPAPITKQEEKEAFNIIKKHFAKEWPDIGKHIRKIEDWPSTHPELRTNAVRFEYNNGKHIAVFELYRTLAGLWVQVYADGDESPRYTVAINVLKQQLTESTESEQLDGSPLLSKRDIHQGIDFIKKKMIPIAVAIYDMKKHIDEPRFTPENVSKELKITYMRDAKYGSTAFLHSILGNYDFKFTICKRKQNGEIGTRRPYRLVTSFMLPTQIAEGKVTSVWFYVNSNGKGERFDPGNSGLVFEEETS